MSNKEIVKTSKFLSLVLRHRPEKIGLVLDAQGWTSVDELIKKTKQSGRKMTLELLEEVVATNNKRRFSFSEDGSKIRANQGHSIPIDLALAPQEPPEFLFHGTASQYISQIFEGGIQRMNRHHVHLSLDLPTATQVGGRHGKPVILKVLAQKMHQAGYEFFCTANDVWLTEDVPSEYLEYA